MPHNVTVPVESHTDLGAGYYLLRLAAPDIAREARAGQFVMLGLTDLSAMLIRRPFSVARTAPGPDGTPHFIDILYKVYGHGTELLSRLRPGDNAAVLGPLGRGFVLPEPGQSVELLAVAGGIGNAIFPLALQELGDRARDVTMFFGGRSHKDLTLLDWFTERCARVVTATEDGSLGTRGYVTAPLIEHLDTPSTRRRLVLACGPRPMLRAVAKLCEERGVDCQIAMEETMACGFGVCLGCVVPTRHPATDFDKFVRVCCEGPVFDAREIVV